MNKGEVSFLHQPAMEMPGQYCERSLSLGYDHQSRSRPVEAVHQTGTNYRWHICNIGEAISFRANKRSNIFQMRSVEVPRKGVCERSGLHSTRRVNEHARRLHYNEQVWVFVDDFKIYWLRTHCGRGVVVEGHFDQVARGDVIARNRNRLIYEAGALFQKGSNPHPADGADSRGEKFIEPLARFFMGYAKLEVLFGISHA